MNVFIQVYRTMQEFAIEHCRSRSVASEGTSTTEDGVGQQQPWNDPVLNWDNAVAIYTGSLEGTNGTGNGHLLYTLADEMCVDFRTCSTASKRESTASGGGRTAAVNVEIFSQFKEGQRFLENGECEFAQQKKDRIIQLMTVPFIQGTIKSAYILEEYGSKSSADTNDDDQQQQQATAAAFAAAILPDVFYCNPDDALTIYENLQIGRTNAVSFSDVKLAFERNYECLGVTCSDIGGYYNSNKGKYFKNAAPCGSRKNSSGGGGGGGGGNASKSSFLSWRVAGILCGMVVVGLAYQSRERILDVVANSRGIATIIDHVGGSGQNEYELGDSSRYSRLVPEQTEYQNLGDSGRYSQNLGDSGHFSQNLDSGGGGMM